MTHITNGKPLYTTKKCINTQQKSVLIHMKNDVVLWSLINKGPKKKVAHDHTTCHLSSIQQGLRVGEYIPLEFENIKGGADWTNTLL